MKNQNQNNQEKISKIGKYFQKNYENRKKYLNSEKSVCFYFAKNKYFKKINNALSEKKLSRTRSRIMVREFPDKVGKGKVLFHKMVNSFFEIVHFHNIKKLIIIAAVFAILSNIYFQYLKLSPRAESASNTWFQTTWTGGADTVNFPNKTNNNSGWTKYYSNTSVDTTNNELKLNRYSN